MITAGLVMAASFGLAAPGVSSAAVPSTLHVLPGSRWTVELNGCMVAVFQANHTFTTDSSGDSGTWSGGGAKLTMTWTAGTDYNLHFVGIFSKTPVKEYTGTFSVQGGVVGTGQVVKGAVAGC
jgi:hypothetical protein